MKRSCYRLFAALVLLFSFSHVAMATDQTDLAVSFKTLPMLINKITGSATVGVVYDPASPDSKADADVIKAALDGGMEAPGGVKLSSVLVSIADLSTMSSTRIAIVTKGLSSAQCSNIAAAAAGKGILTVSADLDCVKSSKCVLGVVSKPSVQIFFSKAAADAAKVEFSPAFAMLATQT